jgi:hypothetical protein
MPSHEKPHYVFSQHDVAKIFHALFASPELHTTALQTCQYWLFLCKSVFMGRLVNQDDCSMCNRIIMNSTDALSEHISTAALLGKQTFVCVRGAGGTPASVQMVNHNINYKSTGGVPAQAGASTSELHDVIVGQIDVSNASVACVDTSPSPLDITACAWMYADVISPISVALHRAGACFVCDVCVCVCVDVKDDGDVRQSLLGR